MKSSKGFTLIELLVVIAIIGILSSVVLASLNTARAKGSDAAIKAQLAAIRPQAELVYDNANSYGQALAATTNTGCTGALAATLFGTTTIDSMIDSVYSTSGTIACVSTGTPASSWAIAASLKTDTTDAWCVDSTGASKLQGSAASTGSFTSGLCN